MNGISDIMSCFWDAVNFRGVCEAADNTVVYINDIPSIDNALLRHLIDDEKINPEKVWETVKRRGINTFYNRILSEMRKKFVPKPIIREVITGQWEQPFEELALENKLVGIKVDLRGSDNLELALRTVEMYCGNAPVSDSIYIYDLETGVLLDSIAYSFDGNGFQVVSLNKSYTGKRLFVCYDASVLQSRETDPASYRYYQGLFPMTYSLSHQHCDGCDYLTLGNYAEIDTGLSVIESNLDGGQAKGMILKYSVNCSLRGWVCNNREVFAPMLMYHLANELFIEAVGSLNINPGTFSNSDEWDNIAMYVNTEFNRLFMPFLDGVQIDDPFCVECNAPTQKAWFIP